MAQDAQAPTAGALHDAAISVLALAVFFFAFSYAIDGAQMKNAAPSATQCDRFIAFSQ
jgi:hypothetical protein